jgi:hypothetical protein
MANPVAFKASVTFYLHDCDFYLLGVKKCLDMAIECGCMSVVRTFGSDWGLD